jgi:hypothetical protein
VFLQHQLLQNGAMPAEDAAAVFAALDEMAADVIAPLPVPLQETFTFAYQAGAPFIQFLHEMGGYDLVDGAWSELPASTEQIIHPERYLAQDLPAQVLLAPLDSVLGEGWQLVAEDTFGEFLLRQYLEQQPLAAAAIDQAATGWGGGRYAVYQDENGPLPAVVIRLAWDSTQDENEFYELYASYTNTRHAGAEAQLTGEGLCWETEDVSCLFRDGGETLIIRAPTLELAQTAAGAQLNISQP